MRNFGSICLITMVLGLSIYGCNNHESGVTTTEIDKKTKFDSLLAQKLGADDYGMRSYVMAFLKTGSVNFDSGTSAKLGRGHMENIGRLANEGKLVLAGPFMGDSVYRGIYVFDVQSLEEARELTQTDPAIKAGIFDIELIPWYGSAALMEVNRIHEQIAKIMF